MSTIWRKAPGVTRLKAQQCQVRCIADLRPFACGDLVILRQKLDRSAPPILTRPLKPGRQINGHKGIIEHEQIIGKRVRDVVKTAILRSGKDGTEYRLHEVKLEEYVRLSRRLVTPIYPADASLIVDLLDLHVEPFHPNDNHENKTKLEILEAGTGHGALTLFLSRAIHAANAPPPRLDNVQDDESKTAALEVWKRDRCAVIHTIDSSAKVSKHAENVVNGFKRGMYYHHVDFHVTDVSVWTRRALSERDEVAFLSHAILDLPGAEEHIGVVAEALRTDGCLMVFNPSITQILDCVRTIREEGILLELDNVIELGVNGGSGGREWNVRAVKPRSTTRGAKTLQHQNSDNEGDAEVESKHVIDAAVQDRNSDDGVILDRDDAPDRSTSNQRWSMICRPKVGERIVGGGFLGIWRKQRDMRDGS